MKKKPPSSPSPKTYKVGYKRPPKENQFQSGQSGNPPGRKKGSKSIKAMIAELVSEPVEVKGADGKKKRLPRLQVILLLAASHAMRGDIRWAKLFLELVAKFIQGDMHRDEGIPFTDDDHAILARWKKRYMPDDGSGSPQS